MQITCRRNVVQYFVYNLQDTLNTSETLLHFRLFMQQIYIAVMIFFVFKFQLCLSLNICKTVHISACIVCY
jgi:hypothetical protein